MLEAKVYLGNGLVGSLASEPIANDPDYEEKKLSDETIKQDCESKAFKRLAGKIKKRFPRLPICIVADALYISDGVVSTCRENGWEYILRYKTGSAPSIQEDYDSYKEKCTAAGGIEYINGVIFHEHDVNMLHYREENNGRTTAFSWITSMEISARNAGKIVRAGRNRWKIENQGFNRQKRWQGDIEHACSWNERAQFSHYLMEQIADLMKQLYEYYYLRLNGIKKAQKNISPELLISFGQRVAGTGDIDSEGLRDAALS